MIRRARAALVVVLLCAPAAASAQEAPEPPSGYRRYLLAAGGAAALGGLAMLAGEGHQGGTCSDRKCLGAIGITLGAIVGYMVGSDLDERAAASWTPLAELEPGTRRELGLPGLPHRLVRAPDGLLVLDAERLSRIDRDLRLTPIPAALRPRDALVLPDGERVLVVSAGGLYRVGSAGLTVDTFPVAGGTALGRLADDAAAVAGAGSLRRLRLPETGAPQPQASAAVEGVPQVLATAEAGTLWLISAERLEARDPATLEPVGSLTLAAPAASLSVSGELALAALGRGGVALVDIADPARPRLLSTLEDSRHAYAAAALGERVYVAAGSQGVLVYDASDPRAPRAIGRIGGFDSAVDVLAADGRLHVLDRAERRLHVIEP